MDVGPSIHNYVCVYIPPYAMRRSLFGCFSILHTLQRWNFRIRMGHNASYVQRTTQYTLVASERSSDFIYTFFYNFTSFSQQTQQTADTHTRNDDRAHTITIITVRKRVLRLLVPIHLNGWAKEWNRVRLSCLVHRQSTAALVRSCSVVGWCKWCPPLPPT